MRTFIIATRNKHKVEEIRSILGEGECRFLTLNDFPDAPPIVEDGKTFPENAARKSVGIARWLVENGTLRESENQVFVLADDSGLEVDALNGAPGVHSARFAALDTGTPGNSSDHENNAKLIRLLKDVPPEKCTARFRCFIAVTPITNALEELALRTVTFSGACEGRISTKPGGGGGFGYDPLFIPEGYSQSFAELGEEIKNQLSHRSHALKELRRALASL